MPSPNVAGGGEPAQNSSGREQVEGDPPGPLLQHQRARPFSKIYAPIPLPYDTPEP